MGLRLSIDIGGTFTDLVLVDDRGEMKSFKTQTTPENHVDAVINVLQKAGKNLNLSIPELLQEAEAVNGGSLIHGSTITTNAMIEGKVAKTGLICTYGFRDFLGFGEGGKENPFEWDIDFPKPYIPRYLSLPVRERINAEGGIETPLNEADVISLLEKFKSWNVKAIAVSLLWSIANPIHEERIAELIEEYCPGIPYTLGSRINPCIREYRRCSSTAIDASLKPIINRYVDRFQNRLQEEGFSGEVQMLTSSGGVMRVDELRNKPINSVDCGPALVPAAGLWYAGKEPCG